MIYLWSVFSGKFLMHKKHSNFESELTMTNKHETSNIYCDVFVVISTRKFISFKVDLFLLFPRFLNAS